jgi:hypothetical protein
LTWLRIAYTLSFTNPKNNGFGTGGGTNAAVLPCQKLDKVMKNSETVNSDGTPGSSGVAPESGPEPQNNAGHGRKDLEWFEFADDGVIYEEQAKDLADFFERAPSDEDLICILASPCFRLILNMTPAFGLWRCMVEQGSLKLLEQQKEKSYDPATVLVFKFLVCDVFGKWARGESDPADQFVRGNYVVLAKRIDEAVAAVDKTYCPRDLPAILEDLQRWRMIAFSPLRSTNEIMLGLDFHGIRVALQSMLDHFFKTRASGWEPGKMLAALNPTFSSRR